MNNAEYIWHFLMNQIRNPYGVAGLMGNLFAESGLNSFCKTGQAHTDISGEEYADLVDNGQITAEDFDHDGVAFGLVQWCYWSRKEGLYKKAVEMKRSIGDLDLQLRYLIDEIQKYKIVWETLTKAKTVVEASDIVMLKYEKPANTSSAAKLKRAEYGERYYDTYGKTTKKKILKVRSTVDNVNLRSGNGRQFGIVGGVRYKGTNFPWVATSENKWYAIEAAINGRKSVVWISGEYSEMMEDFE